MSDFICKDCGGSWSRLIDYEHHSPCFWSASEQDAVNHPKHYTSHPSGVECITVTEHYGFCIGNAIKYLWRAGLKGDAIEDLRKAVWYIEREIAKRERAAAPSQR